MSRPTTLLLPPGARAYRLETERGGFAVHEACPADGPVRGTALLVPGFTGSKEDFTALLEPLSRAGWRVVAVDGRGQYESGGPRTEAAYAQRELAADLVAQARALEAGPVHLLGHSMGGLVARAAVLDQGGPGPWASLTLMSSGPAAIGPARRELTGMLVAALATMDLEAVWQAVREADPERSSPAGGAAAGASPAGEAGDAAGKAGDAAGEAGAADEAAAGLEEFLHRRWLANVPEQLIVTGRQLVNEPDRVAELAAVGLRTLVLSGAEDHAWPVPWLDAMAVALGARRVVVEGAGHSPNAERPAETAAALDAFWGAPDTPAQGMPAPGAERIG